MEELKKQINESFFNPTLYFLPILAYVVSDDFWGTDMAWKISFPISIFILFYIYISYKRLFVWNVTICIGYLLIGSLTTVLPFFTTNEFLLCFIDEIIFLLLLLFSVFGQSYIERIGLKSFCRDVPLSNNMNELNHFAKLLSIIIVLYLIVNVWIIDYELSWIANVVFLVLILLSATNETIRVFFVRQKLLNEDWLPIVNTFGKVTGACQYQKNVRPKNKNLHPVVRCYFLDNGLLFLQQRKSDDVTDPLYWDASVSRHIRIGESIEDALKERAKKLYEINLDKAFFLTKYVHRGVFNNQFIHLFVACKKDLKICSKNYESVKWWTTKQIEDNLGKDVFTKRFESEYEILKRSGLLNSNHCGCP